MSFYAIYPPSAAASSSVQTVQGEGTPGVPVGGLLTIQGDPSGTAVPVTGSITATNPSVAPTGAAVPADATYAGMNVSGNLTGLTGTVNGLQTVINAAIPAGTAIIGKVGIDQTTPGTTNGVQVNAALPAGGNTIGAVTQASGPWTENITQFGGNAVVTGTGVGGNGIPRVTVSSDSTIGLVAGTAIIGKVSIDQTTPGTTNGVQVNAALPAGANSIGNIGTVTTVTTVSTVTAVTAISNALPAGTNLLGKVGIDQTTPGTTNAVQATSGTTIAWQAEGNIAFGSLTNSFQTIFTPSASTKILFIRNNTNAAVSISMDAGSTTNFILDSGDQVAIDFVANGVVSTTTAIQVKYTVGAPTSGSVRVNGGH